ncbi:MAG TPA: aminodeoxychorismate/anthranilate synthase component II [Spirochaetota bacterium]|nr:aminodeoxychorismate/anthranilate synthase component II [Spirochaetota bacterium]
MFLMVDNYDSFTFNIVQYFLQCGEEVDVVRNDSDVESIDFSAYEGIVLSPGPSSPENAGITLEVIRRHGGRPMLGICLGMQSLAYVYGGDVVRAEKIMHGKEDRITHEGGRLFGGIPETFTAVRYHSLVASGTTLPDCFEVMARSSDGEIMAIRHREHFTWGVQFHPESYSTEFGMEIIQNFIGGTHEYNSRHNTGN